MEFVERVENYKIAYKVSGEARERLEEASKGIESDILKILKMYYEKENEVYRLLDHVPYTFSNCVVPYTCFDEFSISSETEDYYNVDYRYTDRDRDVFVRSIKVPKDLNRVGEFVGKFGDYIKDMVEEGNRERIKRREDEDYNKYLYLKEKFKDREV